MKEWTSPCGGCRIHRSPTLWSWLVAWSWWEERSGSGINIRIGFRCILLWLWVAVDILHVGTSLGRDVKMTRGGVCAGRIVSLQPWDRVLGVAQERGVMGGLYPQTPPERGLEGPPPCGIVGLKNDLMKEIVGMIPMVLLSLSCYSSSPTRINWRW